ncbi:MAG: peptide ABC transporter substrate-binding protein, partial [Gemmatimonadetes bacterium]|nr:peptide ABC transporter substrate-binding protein [Gemmatimonadota bacterium]
MRSALLLAAVWAALCTGCGADVPETGREGEPVTVTVLNPDYEFIFNPLWDMPAKFLLFLPMVRFDDSGEVVPSLARSWENSDDYREWTYHLRTDVTWHDGVPVTARDVRFSLELMARPDIGYYGPLESVAVHDDSTITIRTPRPQGVDWWTVFYPQHLLQQLDPAGFFEWEFWTRPVGNGPFRYVRHEPNTVWEMEANPAYYTGRPAIDRLRIKFGGGEALPELLSGQVDAASYVRREDLPQLEADARFDVYYLIEPDVGWLEGIFWNLNHPFLGDPAVRRALTLAVNRRELRELQGIPGELPFFDGFFTGRQFWSANLPYPHPYDPSEAKRLLEARGWLDRDGDGVRERGGQHAQFTALAGGGGSDQTFSYGQAAVYVQAALRKVGVVMDIQRVESGLRQRLLRGDFDAAFTRILQFPRNLQSFFQEESGPGWSDPTMLNLLEAAQQTQDPDARDSLYAEMSRLMESYQPLTLLAPQVQWFVASNRIKGLSSPFR